MSENEYSRANVLRWMKARLQEGEHIDARTGEVNLTSLAETAAGHFGVDDEGGPLDDPDHWIWEAAFDVAAAHGKGCHV